jgi:hypothetical protein
MRRLSWTAVTIAAVAAVAAIVGTVAMDATGNDGDGQRHTRGCSEATLHGDYGIQITGTRPSAPGGAIESVIGVVIRTYDGEGRFTQIDNVKGSISGITPNRPGDGTYRVNRDCTGLATAVPGPGILLEEQLVIVDSGLEVRSAVVNPPPVMVIGTQKKIDIR